LMPPTCAKLV